MYLCMRFVSDVVILVICVSFIGVMMVLLVIDVWLNWWRIMYVREVIWLILLVVNVCVMFCLLL